MSSVFFRIEVYGKKNFGCPELDLMGYNDIEELLKDCWKKDHKEFMMKDVKNHIQRMDGRLEWICPHGIGHTIKVPKKYENDDSWWSHCCDGCCSEVKDD